MWLFFDFLSKDDLAKASKDIKTGHANGVVTLLISEADPVVREQVKKQMAERYRTLLGHFRHEVGHYYWDQLIRDDEHVLQ
ncbi:MAG: putative zinc-binding metallopeptidase, partial [Maribacter arcticus]|uniref:putative zinc-binding metallopeptidase n=1 Tax=Maribacter arcticus TaxID=561365 RepID=UPI003002619D